MSQQNAGDTASYARIQSSELNKLDKQGEPNLDKTRTIESSCSLPVVVAPLHSPCAARPRRHGKRMRGTRQRSEEEMARTLATTQREHFLNAVQRAISSPRPSDPRLKVDNDTLYTLIVSCPSPAGKKKA